MRIGIIDCGTNTFNLLISEEKKGVWTTVFKNKIAVKLGKGGMSKGIIPPERLARGMDALNIFYNVLLNFQVKHVRVFATSALRDAGNTFEFVKEAKARFNFDLQIIDGDREAQLIFEGVKQTIELSDELVTVIDIGGGSTEFIIGNKDGVKWKISLPLGVARIYEFVQPSDPLTQEEIKRLGDYFSHILSPLTKALKAFPSKTLVGSSGSFDTLFELHALGLPSPIERKLSNPIPLDVFFTLHSKLLQSNRAERIAIPGMVPLRVDYIPLATLLIEHLLKNYGFNHLIHSDYALKEGALKEAAAELLSLE